MLAAYLPRSDSNAYWLVDSKAHRLAVKALGFGFDEAVPLFFGETFAPAMDLSPWLIPVTEQVTSLDDVVLDLGILLRSERPVDEVIDHLRSLLIASLDGEEVMFRYYDKKVLLAMLQAMDESERYAFMGNIDTMILAEQEVHEFKNNASKPFELNVDVWWRLLPHHMDALYDVQNHAKILERRLWELIPNALAQFDSPSNVIIHALESAIERNYEKSQLESCVIIEVAKQANLHLSELSMPLRLTFDELKALQSIKETWS